MADDTHHDHESNAPKVDRRPGDTDVEAMERAQKDSAERQEKDGGGYE